MQRLCRKALFAGAVLLLGLPHDGNALDNLAIEQVADGVYVHQGQIELMSPGNQGDIANTGFIVGDDAVAVIDTGGSVAVGKALLAAIRTVTYLPIRYVINTHMHPDHVFGNAAFKPEAPDFVGHAKLPRALATRAEHYLAANRDLLGADLIGAVEIIQPKILIDGSRTLDLGGRVLTLMAWPTAHTDNDLTVFDDKTQTLFTGDLLFAGHVPVIDGSIRGWLKVMSALASVETKRAVPGHGPASVPWPDTLAAQRAYLQHLETDIRDIIARGGSIRNAADDAGRSEHANWQLFDEFNARSATAAFSELEWE